MALLAPVQPKPRAAQSCDCYAGSWVLWTMRYTVLLATLNSSAISAEKVAGSAGSDSDPLSVSTNADNVRNSVTEK